MIRIAIAVDGGGLEQRVEATDDALRPRSIPPQRMGDYELEQELGRGGMGVVYKARQISLQRLVAIKIVRFGEFAEAKELARFKAEAEAAAQLDHPHIVPIYEVGEHRGRHYFSMKLIEGGTLRDRLPQLRKEIGLRGVAKLVTTVARAVHYAHTHGVLHRDLKPENILLDRQGDPHITDFGLARRLDVESSFTGSGEMLGTPTYMPPEQASGVKRLTTAADVYSIGVLLYELLTGRPPFLGATAMEVLMQVRDQAPIPPQQLNPELDRDLSTLCLKCLEKNPNSRYSSAEALVDDLDRWLRGEPIRARPATMTEKVIKWARRNPAVAALTVGMNLIAWTGILGISWQWHRASAEANQARLNAYAADMNLASKALDEANLDHVVELLDRYRPSRDKPDIRGWEWRHLWQRSQSDSAATIGHHSNEVRKVAFLPGGETLVTGGRDATLKFWKTASWQLLDTFPLTAGLRSMALSADGKSLVAGTENGKVTFVDVPTRQKRFASESASWNAANELAFSPSGDVFAVGGRRGQIQIVEAASGKMKRLLEVKQGPIRALAFSPNGKLLASGCQEYRGSPTNMLVIWDTSTWLPLTNLNPHPWVVTGLQFSPDSRTLASCGWEPAVKLWDTKTFVQTASLVRHELPPLALAFSSDGKRLASGGGDQRIVIWDVATRVALTYFKGHLGDVWSLAYSPDQQGLISGGKDGTVRLWRETPRQKAALFSPLAEGIGHCKIARDAGIAAGISSDGRVQLWDMRSESSLGTVRGEQAALSPNGAWMATVTKGGRVTLLAVSNLQTLATFSVPSGGVRALEFGPTGSKLCFVGDEGQVTVWEWPHPRNHVSWSVTNRCVALAFAPDGRRVALGFIDGALQIWDLREGRLSRGWIGHRSEVLAMNFSRNGRWLATGGTDATAHIWDAQSGQRQSRLKADRLGVAAIDFSPDDTRVVTSAMDGSVRFWDPLSGQLLLTLKGHPMQPALAFAEKGRLLLTASIDGMRKWEAPDLAQIEAAGAWQTAP
ncbi:MAG: serine/threonine protein kinase [Verrucomicrobia bacterium]|nr:serine/threonine protein kinase [Verrucomicrobiota bacterium]MBI3867585.1 serine/threonine protein kinase [Verrucomicrobiota bacterium]